VDKSFSTVKTLKFVIDSVLLRMTTIELGESVPALTPHVSFLESIFPGRTFRESTALIFI
jgi:hypothetical protein